MARTPMWLVVGLVGAAIGVMATAPRPAAALGSIGAGSSGPIPIVVADHCFDVDPSGDYSSDWLGTPSIQEVTRQTSLLVDEVDGLVGYAIDETNHEVVVVFRPGDDPAAHRAALAGRITGLAQPGGQPPSSVVLTPLCRAVDLEALYEEVATYLWENDDQGDSRGPYEVEMDMVRSRLRLLIPDRSPESQAVVDLAQARYGPDEVAVVVDPEFSKWHFELQVAHQGEATAADEAAKNTAADEAAKNTAADEAAKNTAADEAADLVSSGDEAVGVVSSGVEGGEGPEPSVSGETVAAVAGSDPTAVDSPPEEGGSGIAGWWLAAGAVVGLLAVVLIGLPRVIREPARSTAIRRRDRAR